MLNNNLGKRIREIIEEVGSQSLLSVNSGVSQPTINKWLNSSDVSPNLDKLYKVAIAANVRPAWLAFGDLPKYEDENILNDDSFKDDEYTRIKRFDVQAGMGSGGIVDEEKEIAPIIFRTEILRKRTFNPQNLHAISARGDSMYPLLSDGDLVVVDISQHKITDNGVYVINLEGHLFIKRLIRRFEDSTVTIISDNPDKNNYPDEKLSKSGMELLTVIGKAVWAGKWLG